MDASQLTPLEFMKFPVWEFFTDRENIGDTLVRAVSDLPVSTLAGRLVGTTIQLANGQSLQGMLGNVNLKNPMATRHFLSLAVWIEGHWFHLARYHDVDREDSGPEVLAATLGLPVTDVFPITYDLSGIAEGPPDACTGRIDYEPGEKLTAAQLAKLSIRI